jgi:hypothetical protein
MSRIGTRIGSVAVIAAAVVAALWFLQQRPDDPLPPVPERAHASRPAEVPRPSAPRDLPPPAAAIQEKPAEAPSLPPRPEPMVRKPSSGLRPSDARSSKRLEDFTEQEQQTYRLEILRYQKSWEEYLGPLLYPPGHPKEGEYREGVTLDEAVEAQLLYYDATDPRRGSLDEPKLHIMKRIPFEAVNERQKTWDQTDLASTRAFYDWLKAQPEDERVPMGDFWLPADPSDPEATTRKQFLRERIIELEAPMFEEPTQ